KEALRCPAAHKTGTLIVLGNFAWQYCVQEIFALVAMTDINTKPGPTQQDLVYMEDMLKRNPLFHTRVVVDYEIPQFDLWSFSTRGLRYPFRNGKEEKKSLAAMLEDDGDSYHLVAHGEDDAMKQKASTATSKNMASKQNDELVWMRYGDPLDDDYRIDEFSGGDEKIEDYGGFVTWNWENRNPFIRWDNIKSDGHDDHDSTLIAAGGEKKADEGEIASRADKTAGEGGDDRDSSCSVDFLDHDIYLPREYQASHNEEKRGARTRKKMDLESKHMDREAAMKLLGAGVGFSVDDTKPKRHKGRLEHLNFYDGRAIGRKWHRALWLDDKKKQREGKMRVDKTEVQGLGEADELKSDEHHRLQETAQQASVSAEVLSSENDVPPGEVFSRELADIIGIPAPNKGDLDHMATVKPTTPHTFNALAEDNMRVRHMRIDPLYTVLNIPHATFWRQFHRTMHVDFNRVLHRRQFYPTHVLYLCPFTHKLLRRREHVDKNGRDELEKQEDTSSTPGTTCPEEDWEKKLTFLQMPYPTKNVFELDEERFPDDEAYFAARHDMEMETRNMPEAQALSNAQARDLDESLLGDDQQQRLRSRDSRGALVMVAKHTPFRDRKHIDLFYAGNCMMEHQREMFMPTATAKQKFVVPGGMSVVKSSSSLSKKNGGDDELEGEDAGGMPMVNFHVLGNSQERLSKVYLGPEYESEYRASGVRLHFVPGSETITNDEKLAIYGRARICYT
ncbi:unnamed protein product, partial [Amoebophrya sp. A25]